MTEPKKVEQCLKHIPLKDIIPTPAMIEAVLKMKPGSSYPIKKLGLHPSTVMALMEHGMIKNIKGWEQIFTDKPPHDYAFNRYKLTEFGLWIKGFII